MEVNRKMTDSEIFLATNGDLNNLRIFDNYLNKLNNYIVAYQNKKMLITVPKNKLSINSKITNTSNFIGLFYIKDINFLKLFRLFKDYNFKLNIKNLKDYYINLYYIANFDSCFLNEYLEAFSFQQVLYNKDDHDIFIIQNDLKNSKLKSIYYGYYNGQYLFGSNKQLLSYYCSNVYEFPSNCCFIENDFRTINEESAKNFIKPDKDFIIYDILKMEFQKFSIRFEIENDFDFITLVSLLNDLKNILKDDAFIDESKNNVSSLILIMEFAFLRAKLSKRLKINIGDFIASIMDCELLNEEYRKKMGLNLFEQWCKCSEFELKNGKTLKKINLY